MVLGVIVVIAGLSLAIRPLGAARFAHNLRMVPYSADTNALRYYRMSGLAIAAAGLALALF